MTVQYQGVWSLQSAAQLQSTQRWVTDPLYKNTTLLLQADDAANAAQNNTFLDSSSNSFAITRNGNTTQGTFTPFSLQPGAWSGYMGSSGATVVAIFLNGEADFAFGTGDFTIEMWVYLNSSGANQVVYDQRPASTNGAYPTIYLNNSTTKLTYYANTADRITQTSAFTYNTWHHVVVTRTGTSTKMFIDGIQEGSTYTDSTNYLNGTNRPCTTNGNSNNDGAVGYISNLRIVKGSGPYQSAGSSITVPTAPLTPVANTVLLTLQSNRFVDTNTQVAAKTVNVSNNPSIQPFSPFAPQFQWTPSVIGGSGYFDGNGDQLVAPSNTALAMGTGDFQIEFWAYHTSIPASFTYIDTRPTGTNGSYITLGYNNSGNGIFLYVNAMLISTGLTPVANAWTHFVLSRVGSTTRLFRDGSQIGSASDGTNYAIGAQGFGIGENTIAAGNNFFGYMAGFRVVKGSGVTSVTVPTAPPTAITNTQLLLNFTNAGIYDGTMKNNLETVGNAQVSTAVVKYGSGSLAFDGSGDYIYANSSAANSAFGTGNFTVEFWLYTNAASTTYNIIDWRPSATNGAYLSFYLNAGVPTVYVNTANLIVGGAGIPGASWTHIAICRANNATRLFINGTQSGSTAADTTNYIGSLNRPAIGGGGFDTGSTLNGYIDDLRITKGIARYTQNFIPPSVALPRQ